MTHRDLMETWFDRAWSQRDETAVDEMFAPELDVRGLGDPRVTREQVKAFHRAILEAYEDIRIEILECVESGDWIAVLCRMTGTFAKTGEAVEMTGTVFSRVRDGRFVEAHDHWNFMLLYEQTGQFPPRSFDRLLHGGSLGD